jgi:hypothetical protein
MAKGRKKTQHQSFSRGCPECGRPVERKADAFLAHFQKNHKIKLTDAEASRMAKGEYKKSKGSRRATGKSVRAVSGGLPSLGKKR